MNNEQILTSPEADKIRTRILGQVRATDTDAIDAVLRAKDACIAEATELGWDIDRIRPGIERAYAVVGADLLATAYARAKANRAA